MANKKVFGDLCRQVCLDQAWELLPTGISVSLAGGRKQLVSLEFFEYEREELVRLFTTIGDVGLLEQERLVMALRINAGLAHGALAVKEDHLIMTDTLLLKDADAQEIEASIGFLASTADYYEKTLFGTDEH